MKRMVLGVSLLAALAVVPAALDVPALTAQQTGATQDFETQEQDDGMDGGWIGLLGLAGLLGLKRRDHRHIDTTTHTTSRPNH